MLESELIENEAENCFQSKPPAKIPESNPVATLFPFKEWIPTIIMCAALFFSINFFTARVRVIGDSMYPTLEEGELLLVDRMRFREGSFQRGDIIVFNHPISRDRHLVKRIIGLPGEKIKIENGVIYINGKALKETYLGSPTNYESEFRVPANSYYVLGDNRDYSSDSHNWGFLPAHEIIGKAVAIYYPLNRFSFLN